VASGPEFDCRIIEDLIDDITLFTCLPHGTTLDCFTQSLRELHARGVHLFVCLDHDCIYRRRYIESICSFITSSGLDVEEGAFCLNLIDQQWVTLYDDARAEIAECSFRAGLGLAADEAQRIVVGAPPTFVFGRRAAAVVIDAADGNSGRAPDGYHDIFWRRALADAGIRITQVRTPEPVFAYVRHSNNLCWGNKQVGSSGKRQTGAPATLAPPPTRVGESARYGIIDVSVVIPTYNEGEWLSRTVESIREAKTDLQYEIVIADDGCTDGSIEAVRPSGNLRIVKTGGEQLGLIVAKNTGAKAASGRYLCFIDSHILVHDHWLDYLRQTCDEYPNGALVSGNLPDVARRTDQADRDQYGYMFRDCLLHTGWHFYGKNRTDRPYSTPLTPGGLMFTRKLHFARIGGFESCLRKWGAEDIQISLHNYFIGGENVVDPRVIVYHYYKCGKNKKINFVVSTAQHWFNCLHVAAAYFPPEYYAKVRDAILSRGGAAELVAEIESAAHQQRLSQLRLDFIRGFSDWTARFAVELRKFFRDAEKRPEPMAAAREERLGDDGRLALAGGAR
jgi:glycosyltransferase involved in cell wall biosynthesis